MEPNKLERAYQTIRDLRAELLQLQSRVSQVETSPILEMVRQEIAGLVIRIDGELHGLEPRSGKAVFDRLLALDPAVQRINKLWRDIRTDAGRVVAEEIIIVEDIYGGWRKRWGDLTEVAWQLRGELEQERASPRLRSPQFPVVLALDLRYAAGLSLSEIGELFNVSPAAIQMRLSELEEAILLKVVHNSVERQVPAGWRLAERDEPTLVDGRAIILRHVGYPNARPVVVSVLQGWGEREGMAGRPRSSPVPPRGRVPGRGMVIWAVVFSEGPAVMFVPEKLYLESVGQNTITSASITDFARIRGLSVLADALNAAEGSNGDTP